LRNIPFLCFSRIMAAASSLAFWNCVPDIVFFVFYWRVNHAASGVGDRGYQRTEAAAFFWALARSVSRWLPRVIVLYRKRRRRPRRCDRELKREKSRRGGAFIAGVKKKGLSPWTNQRLPWQRNSVLSTSMSVSIWKDGMLFRIFRILQSIITHYL
jgi:hypothetical protein